MKRIVDNLIRFEGLPTDEVRRLSALLCYPNPQYEAAKRFSIYGRVSPKIPRTISHGWACSDGSFAAYRGFDPRVYYGGYEELALFLQSPLEDRRVSSRVQWPKARIELHAEQQQLMNGLEQVFERNLRPYGNLPFLASTAVGKTIFQLAVAERLGHRTLVLCASAQILMTWLADIEKLFGIRKADVGLIKRSTMRIGEIITIASIQTLTKRQEHWAELNSLFGTVILDEMQIVGAPSVFAFMKQTPAKWLVGATATDTKADKLNMELKAIFGKAVAKLDLMHRATTTSLPISQATVVETAFEYAYQTDNIQWFDLAEKLACDEGRNVLIVDNIERDYQSGRVCLVATKSVGHVELLVDMLKERGIPAEKLTGETNADAEYSRMLVVSVNRRTVRVIVATSQAVRIGANIRALDTLHVVIPYASRDNMEQLIGRIRRKCHGKKDARITYYLDTKVPYLYKLYRNVTAVVFKKCRIAGFTQQYY